MVLPVEVVRSRAARARRRRCLALALAGLAAVFGHVSLAAAGEPERVVLAGMPENLADATSTVLVPWRIELVRVAETPATDETRARRDVEGLAARTRAGAVVWLAPAARSVPRSADRRPTLWVYDASSERVLSRPLPSAPPYDEPTAASVALSIKTLLRHSSVAPPAERVALPPPPPPGPPTFTAGAHAALRMSRTGTGDTRVEPRLGLDFTWWPAFLPAHLGMGLELELGSGHAMEKSGFHGRFHDVTTTLALRREIALPWGGERVAVVPMLGVGLHGSGLRGTQNPKRQPVSTFRLVPSVVAGLDVQARLGRIVRIGATLHGALMTRTDDYQSGKNAVFEAPVSLVGAGIGLLVSL